MYILFTVSVWRNHAVNHPLNTPFNSMQFNTRAMHMSDRCLSSITCNVLRAKSQFQRLVRTTAIKQNVLLHLIVSSVTIRPISIIESRSCSVLKGEVKMHVMYAIPSLCLVCTQIILSQQWRQAEVSRITGKQKVFDRNYCFQFGIFVSSIHCLRYRPTDSIT